MTTANEALLDAAVRHAIFLERFKGSEAKRLVALFREVEQDLIAQLAKRDPTAVKGRYTRRRLELLLADVREIIAAFSKQLELALFDTFAEIGAIETDFQLRALAASIPVTIEFVRPTAAQVRAAIFGEPMQGLLLKDWFAGLERVIQDRVKAAIRLGVVEGQGIAEIGRRIRAATDQSRRGAEMVARTAINYSSQAARQALYAENSEVIKGVRWVATLDGRTSAVCRARDGEVFPIESGPRPPAHPNCRSSTVPVLRSWRELGISLPDAPEGTRASLDGQVPASTTYQEWLGRQPAAFQDEVLGKTKGALFRRGGLTLDKFVMRDGSELTIAELRAKHGEAFAKAGI